MGGGYTCRDRLLEGTEALYICVPLFRIPKVDGAAQEGDQGGIQLPRLIGVHVPRRRGRGGQWQERGDPSVSIFGAGIDALLLDGKRFYPRAFRGGKVLYLLFLTLVSPLLYPPRPSSPS